MGATITIGPDGTATPKNVTIKTGQVVTFVNKDARSDRSRSSIQIRIEFGAVPLVAKGSDPIFAASDSAGAAYLQFSQVGSDTILQRAFAVSPLRLLAPRTPGAARWVYLATYGGGLVGGDSIHMTIDVARGARALLASQASTKIYRSVTGARQHVRGRVGEDALLAILPDPVVCFSGSSFYQQQTYDLTNGASLVLVDWMTSGRHASGERWAFHRYESRVEVRRNGQRVVYDGLRLSTDEGDIADRMGRFNVCLVAILVGPLVSPAGLSTSDAIAGLPVEKNVDLIVSAAKLGDEGALLKIAGVCVEQVGAVLRDHLRPLTPLFGDDPWTRKW